jgi:hypothetical protein
VYEELTRRREKRPTKGSLLLSRRYYREEQTEREKGKRGSSGNGGIFIDNCEVSRLEGLREAPIEKEIVKRKGNEEILDTKEKKGKSQI